MIQNRKQYRAAVKLLREMRIEHRRLERKMLIKPIRKVDQQKHEELGLAIPLLESETSLFNDIENGDVELDFNSIHQTGVTLVMGRIFSRLTQAQLAAIAGVNRQMLVRYERTFYQNASLKQIRKVADGLESAIAKRKA